MTLSELIKHLRKEKGLTQAKLADMLGVSMTAVSSWELGKCKPLMDKVSKMAQIFEVPISRFFEVDEFKKLDAPDMVYVPIIGRISCGAGTIAYEDVEGYELVPRDWVADGEYFFLRASGDSMIGARILDGDLVLIRKQDFVNHGEIAAVLINGEDAVLKKVFYQNGTIILQSANPDYPPIVCPPAEVRIIGKLVMNVIKY